jgi:hypothetical protein
VSLARRGMRLLQVRALQVGDFLARLRTRDGRLQRHHIFLSGLLYLKLLEFSQQSISPG